MREASDCSAHLLSPIHVLPALVSVVQSRLLPQNISGQEFLNAFVIGYDVGARIGLASQLNPHMHPHGTWGVIGAASAIGVLLKFGHVTLIKPRLKGRITEAFAIKPG